MNSPTSEKALCCCDPIAPDCVGCKRWLADIPDIFIATVTAASDCGNGHWTDQALEGSAGIIPGQCFVQYDINWPGNETYTGGHIILLWNPATERFDWQLAGFGFHLAECDTGASNAEESEYICTECYFKLVLSMEIGDDGIGTCDCVGPVILTIELDLSDGPECEE